LSGVTGAPSASVKEEPWDRVETIAYTDVSTAEDESAQNGYNYVDIYVPDTGAESYPVVLWVHGGAWRSGTRKDVILNNTRDYLLANGFAFVSAEYTLSEATDSDDFTTITNATQGKQAVYDLKAAIRFLRANAEEYHLNADFICAMGESAGAHLALVLATSNGDEEHEDLSMGWADQSSDVQAVVAYSAPADLTEETAPEDSTNLLFAVSAMGYDYVVSHLEAGEVNFAGHNDGDDELTDAENFLSPYAMVSSDTPAMYLIHGELDGAVPYYQAEAMAEVAEMFMDNEFKTAFYPQAGHVDKMYFDSYAQYTDVCDFVTRQLEAMQ